MVEIDDTELCDALRRIMSEHPKRALFKEAKIQFPDVFDGYLVETIMILSGGDVIAVDKE